MATPNSKRMYGDAMIGVGVRRTIADTTTYRLRRGNGFYGSILGELYQDKFDRVVPSSINNPESDSYRTLFQEAVIYWQTVLTDDEKKEYNRRAQRGLRMSGYNLFISEVLKGVFEIAIPSGIIAMWSGLLANIPTGWALCDGTNGRPDLRHKFVRGAGAAQDPGDTGGSESHTHVVSGNSAYYNPQHRHGIAFYSCWPKCAAGYCVALCNCSGCSPGPCRYKCHTHSVNGFSGYENINHMHGISFTSQSCSTLPSFYELLFIQKD